MDSKGVLVPKQQDLKFNLFLQEHLNRESLCTQACNIDILFMEWMLPLWRPFGDQYSLLL